MEIQTSGSPTSQAYGGSLESMQQSVLSGGSSPRTPFAISSRDVHYLPVYTNTKFAYPSEESGAAELRAYKLGKRRWLYNECRLNFTRALGAAAELQIVEVIRQPTGIAPEFEECGVSFSCKLTNLTKVIVHIYVVYDEPEEISDAMQLTDTEQISYRWRPVRRRDCCKSCQGSVLRAIQRYGRISKRTKKGSPASSTKQTQEQAKDPRYLYLSIDEASTHVGSKRFRLVAAVFDEGQRLLATSVSLPINVLANNDAPHGPATIDLDLPLSEDWIGWSVPDMVQIGSGEIQEPYSAPQARIITMSSSSRQHSEGGSQEQRGRRSISSERSDPLSFIRKRALECQSPERSLQDELRQDEATAHHFSVPLFNEDRQVRQVSRWSQSLRQPWQEGLGSAAYSPVERMAGELRPLRTSFPSDFQTSLENPNRSSSHTWGSSQSRMSSLGASYMYTMGNQNSAIQQAQYRLPSGASLSDYYRSKQASAPPRLHPWRPSGDLAGGVWQGRAISEPGRIDPAIRAMLPNASQPQEPPRSTMIPISSGTEMQDLREVQNPLVSLDARYTFNPFAEAERLERNGWTANPRSGGQTEEQLKEGPPWQ